MTKLPAIAAFAICCCALSDVPVAAQSCDERYPQSCSVAVSTTSVVGSKGDTEAIASRSSRRIKGSSKRLPIAQRSSRRIKGASKRLPKAPRLAAASVPLPRPSPRSLAASESVPLPPPSPSPVTDLPATAGPIVDETFNGLTLKDDSQMPLPPPSPNPVTDLPATAGPIVDETFNVKNDAPSLLGRALIKLRDHILGFEPRDPSHSLRGVE
jgi:hypothetical protein